MPDRRSIDRLPIDADRVAEQQQEDDADTGRYKDLISSVPQSTTLIFGNSYVTKCRPFGYLWEWGKMKNKI